MCQKEDVRKKKSLTQLHPERAREPNRGVCVDTEQQAVSPWLGKQLLPSGGAVDLPHKCGGEMLQQSWRVWEWRLPGAQTPEMSWGEAAVEMRCHPCYRRATALSLVA